MNFETMGIPYNPNANPTQALRDYADFMTCNQSPAGTPERRRAVLREAPLSIAAVEQLALGTAPRLAFGLLEPLALRTGPEQIQLRFIDDVSAKTRRNDRRRQDAFFQAVELAAAPALKVRMIDAAALASVDFETAAAVGGAHRLRDAGLGEGGQRAIHRDLIDAVFGQGLKKILHGRRTVLIEQGLEHQDAGRGDLHTPFAQEHLGLGRVIVSVRRSLR